jgi:adenosylcobinamide amidohydrolase
MFWKNFALILSLFSTAKMAEPRQLLTTVPGAVAMGTITVLSMVVRAFTAVSMLTTIMVAKDAKMVILLLSLALNITRNVFLA